MLTPPERTNVRDYAVRRSRRRAMRVAALAPVAVLESLPRGIFHHHLPGLAGLGRTITMIADVGGETLSDIRAARNGDPVVLCGRIHREKPKDFYEQYAATLVDDRVAFTFGYHLTIDVVWAGRIARDGHLIEVVDRIGTDKTVRSTRHIFRRAVAGGDIVLLCNSDGTAVADEKEIPDAALVSWLRDVLTDKRRADPSTEP